FDRGPCRSRAGAARARRRRADRRGMLSAACRGRSQRLGAHSARARRLPARRHGRYARPAMSRSPNRPIAATRDPLLDAVRGAGRTEHFLEVAPAEEARARFPRHLDLAPLPGERVPLADALGRVLGADVAAAVDAPPFDRANVDGFAVHAADTTGASDAA